MQILLAAAAAFVLWAMIRFVLVIKDNPYELADMNGNNPYAESPIIEKPGNFKQKIYTWAFMIGFLIFVYSGSKTLLGSIFSSFSLHSPGQSSFVDYLAGLISLLSWSAMRIFDDYAKHKAWANAESLLDKELKSLILLPADNLKIKQKEYLENEQNEKLEWRVRVVYYQLGTLIEEKLSRQYP